MRAKLVIVFALFMSLFSMVTGIKFNTKRNEGE